MAANTAPGWFAVCDVRLLPPPPCGLSFGIADLMLLQGWAEAQSLQMTVQLDHAVDEEEYEGFCQGSRQQSGQRDPALGIGSALTGGSDENAVYQVRITGCHGAT